MQNKHILNTHSHLSLNNFNQVSTSVGAGSGVITSAFGAVAG